MVPEFIDSLVIKNDTKIIFLIMDGLDGLPMGGRETELEAANTPNKVKSQYQKIICMMALGLSGSGFPSRLEQTRRLPSAPIRAGSGHMIRR